MMEFQRSLAKVLVHEGGYSNHPEDPGGATMKGVTQRVYDDFRKSRNLPTQSVKGLTQAELEFIYKRKYWDLFKGDLMPAGVSYVVFDGAVNSGVSRSVKWLQTALRPYYGGAIDGLVGPATFTAIDQHPDHDRLIFDICQLRMKFLRSLKTWPTFGRGWTARVNGVFTVGQAWATGAEAPVSAAPAAFAGISTAKAVDADMVGSPPAAFGDIAVGGGGVAAVISQSVGQLSMLGSIPGVQNVIIGLTVAGVVVAIGGYLYRAWAKRKEARLAGMVA